MPRDNQIFCYQSTNSYDILFNSVPTHAFPLLPLSTICFLILPLSDPLSTPYQPPSNLACPNSSVLLLSNAPVSQPSATNMFHNQPLQTRFPTDDPLKQTLHINRPRFQPPHDPRNKHPSVTPYNDRPNQSPDVSESTLSPLPAFLMPPLSPLPAFLMLPLSTYLFPNPALSAPYQYPYQSTSPLPTPSPFPNSSATP